MEKLLEGYNYERVSAVYDEFGYIGCSKSHIKCMDIILEKGYDKCVILEDDFILENEEAFCKIANYQGSVNFDILYLGRKKIGNDDEIEIEESKVNYLELPSSLKIS